MEQEPPRCSCPEGQLCWCEFAPGGYDEPIWMVCIQHGDFVARKACGNSVCPWCHDLLLAGGKVTPAASATKYVLQWRSRKGGYLPWDWREYEPDPWPRREPALKDAAIFGDADCAEAYLEESANDFDADHRCIHQLGRRNWRVVPVTLTPVQEEADHEQSTAPDLSQEFAAKQQGLPRMGR